MNQLNEYGTTYIKYEKFLPEEILNKVSEYTNKILENPSIPAFTTNYSWQSVLNFDKQVKSVILTHNMYWTRPGRKISDMIAKYANRKLPKDFECSLGNGPMIHLWPPESCINWHSDFVPDPRDPTNARAPGTRIGALTIYCNTEWKEEWGGKLLLSSGSNSKNINVIDEILPSYNSAVFLQAPFDHSTTPVKGTYMRKSLQIWLKPRL